MLNSAQITAIIPVSDIDSAVEFYEGKLGLKLVERNDDLPQNREAELSSGTGTLIVYESVGAGQSRHTVAAFRVDDIHESVRALRERGVTFEDYDMGELKTEGGVARIGPVQAAWFKDPDGNIVAVESRE